MDPRNRRNVFRRGFTNLYHAHRRDPLVARHFAMIGRKREHAKRYPSIAPVTPAIAQLNTFVADLPTQRRERLSK